MVHEHTSVCGMLMDPQLVHISRGGVSHGGVQVFISPKTRFGLCALGKSSGRARKRFPSFAWSPCSRLLNVCGHGIPKRPSLRLHLGGCLSNRLHVCLLRVRALRRPYSQATLVATPSEGVSAQSITREPFASAGPPATTANHGFTKRGLTEFKNAESKETHCFLMFSEYHCRVCFRKRLQNHLLCDPLFRRRVQNHLLGDPLFRKRLQNHFLDDYKTTFWTTTKPLLVARRRLHSHFRAIA